MITCPTCGKQNQDHYKFCLGCGSELPRDQVKAPAHRSTPTPPSGMPAVAPHAAAPATAQAPRAPAAAPQPMTPARPPAQAAPQPVQQAPAPQPVQQAAPAPAAVPPCKSCGAEIPPGFKFCGRCGTPIVMAAPATAPAPVAAAPLGRIVMIQPDGSEGASVPVGSDGAVVGRSMGAPFSEDFFMSPTHARFSVQGGQMCVEDQGSLNGVYVRLVPEQEYQVNPGDMIRLGQEVVSFDLLPEPAGLPDGTGVMGSPRKAAWGRLGLVVGNGQRGNAFLLEGDEILVGRERGHIIFPEDGYVSGLHVKIVRKGGGYTVIDVGSSNGTYLRVAGKKALASGDYVLMGQYLYKVEC